MTTFRSEFREQAFDEPFKAMPKVRKPSLEVVISVTVLEEEDLEALYDRLFYLVEMHPEPSELSPWELQFQAVARRIEKLEREYVEQRQVAIAKMEERQRGQRRR